MNLTVVQIEIKKSIEMLAAKELLTEALIAKKIRENTRLGSKNKAGLSINDLEVVVEALGDEGKSYSMHLNSANDILLKKSDETRFLDGDAKRRRLQSEKSMSILSNGDFSKNNKKEVNKQKKDRMNKSSRNRMNVNEDYGDE